MSYVPAAGFRALTRFYDQSVALTMREPLWRPLVTRLAAAPVVVDVGCGTGLQTLELDGERVVGVDGDPEALALAQRKAGAERVDWRVGLADSLPVDDGSSDAVVMTLLLHHLEPVAKGAALREAARVLRPGGRLVVADWGRPGGPVPAVGFRALQLFDGRAGTADHAAGRLPSFIAGAGFEPPRVHARVPVVWGTLEVLTAARR